MGEVLGDIVIFVDDSVGAGSASGPGGGAQLGGGGEAEAVRAGGTRLTSVSLTGMYQPGNTDALPVRLCASIQTATSCIQRGRTSGRSLCAHAKRRGCCHQARVPGRRILKFACPGKHTCMGSAAAACRLRAYLQCRHAASGQLTCGPGQCLPLARELCRALRSCSLRVTRHCRAAAVMTAL